MSRCAPSGAWPIATSAGATCATGDATCALGADAGAVLGGVAGAGGAGDGAGGATGAAAAAIADSLEPVDDVHASAGYRRRLVRVLVARALREAYADAAGRVA